MIVQSLVSDHLGRLTTAWRRLTFPDKQDEVAFKTSLEPELLVFTLHFTGLVSILWIVTLFPTLAIQMRRADNPYHLEKGDARNWTFMMCMSGLVVTLLAFVWSWLRMKRKVLRYCDLELSAMFIVVYNVV